MAGTAMAGMAIDGLDGEVDGWGYLDIVIFFLFFFAFFLLKKLY